MSNVAPDLMGKRFQLLKEVAPKVSRVAVLWNPASPVEPFGFSDTMVAAAANGAEIKSIEVRTPEDYPAAFTTVTASRADALLAFINPVNFKLKTAKALGFTSPTRGASRWPGLLLSCTSKRRNRRLSFSFGPSPLDASYNGLC